MNEIHDPASIWRFGSGRSRQPSWRLVILLVTVMGWLSASGCRQGINWGPPGTIGQQRQRAVLHDPYPNNALGPPIESGRPLGFDRPLSEATSTQSSPYARRSGRPANAFGF